MKLRRAILASIAACTMALAPSASASPYNELCGDGTPHGCILHCMQYHGGLKNLQHCFTYHYLV